MKNNPEAPLNEEIKQYLNEDAKTLLQGMNVLHKTERN